MSKTPTKTPESCQQFYPKDLLSPNKDSTGLAKTIFTHITNIHSFLNKWIKVCEKGTKIVKSISALRLYEYNSDFYPHQLTTLTQDLLEASSALRDVVEGVQILNDQLQVLAKLQPTDLPIINTWSASHISSQVSTLYLSMEKEYRLKKVITENIAHCRDENLIEVYASAWEFSVYLNMESNSYLFAEVGLSGII
ncbi:unnamed protein product [Parnassius apollo]|uniref:(apollo) hypothetical protein n=1 Tax=Parnassius apollo TaxID=110799 RepID=A0A8S3XZG1_PARAO|nr:unnamed protein product [Parnassius apollo]